MRSDTRAWLAAKMDRAARRDHMEQYAAKYLLFEIAAAARVLDLGTGDGMLLEVVRENGADVLGVDIPRPQYCTPRFMAYHKGIQAAHTAHSIPVVYSQISGTEQPEIEGKFDIVNCSYALHSFMLEHARKPVPGGLCVWQITDAMRVDLVSIFRWIRGLLADGGCFMLHTLRSKNISEYAEAIDTSAAAAGLKLTQRYNALAAKYTAA